MKKVLTYGLILAVLTVFILLVILRYTLKEKSRLRANNEVLTVGLQQEQTRNNENMSKIGALELRFGEINDHYQDVKDELKNMNVRLRKLTGYTTTATETKYEFHTEFRDSIVRDTVRIEKLEYKTEWIDLTVLKQGLDARVDLTTQDTLIQVVYWERSRKFLFIPFGRKVYSQKIRTLNPHSVIKYSEFIIPRKK